MRERTQNLWTNKIIELKNNTPGDTQNQFRTLSKKDAILYCRIKEREVRKGIKQFKLSWESKTQIPILTHLESGRQFKIVMKQKLVVIQDILKSDLNKPHEIFPEKIEKGTITWMFGRLGVNDVLLENDRYKTSIPAKYFSEFKKS